MKRQLRLSMLGWLAIALAFANAASFAQPAAEQGAESARLNAWLDEQFEQELDARPQWRTSLGDKRGYGRLDEVSEAALDARLAWRRRSVAEMRARFDYEALDEEGKTSHDVWEYELERAERSRPYRRHGYLLGRGGPHAGLPNFMINFHRVDEPSDMEAYVARLRRIGPTLEQYLARAQAAAADGIRQPRFAYDFAIAEIERVLAGEPFAAGRDSPLWRDARGKVQALRESGTLSAEQAERLLGAARAALLDELEPAYRSVLAWLESDRERAAPEAQGVWSLPDGEEYYRERLEAMTTLPLDAEEIHALGLAEVARIRAEMEALKGRVGFEGPLVEFFAQLREEPRFYFPNTDEGRQAYIALAEEYLGGMAQKLPEYFGILPKAALVVRRVESFREQDGAAQHYMAGTPDGSRPGVFYAHLSDMRSMPIYQLESIAFHEGNPGHHMQISIAQELRGLPRFRTQYGYTAFIEGWGLYSEALGKEMGFYTDPYSDFGRLSAEMWRAIRLVVDTGLHAKRWTEEQAVEYFLANAPTPEGAVRSEVERYLTTPGQATAYKIGMLKIQELRARAEERLGERFDIRAFHDVVLGGGALPLPVLEARVARWIASADL